MWPINHAKLSKQPIAIEFELAFTKPRNITSKFKLNQGKYNFTRPTFAQPMTHKTTEHLSSNSSTSSTEAYETSSSNFSDKRQMNLNDTAPGSFIERLVKQTEIMASIKL